MKKRWIALLLAAAVVGLPTWLALTLTGAGASAAEAGEPVLMTAMARLDAAEETARDYTVMNSQADEWESARLQAELIVYYSSDWNWKARHEKEKRCQSALSGGELTVVSLVAADTVEMQILRCVWQKDRLINALRRELAERKE